MSRLRAVLRHAAIQLIAALTVAALALPAAGCGGSSPSEQDASDDPGLIHVHGLGVNPADRALFIATHTGLFRVAEGESDAVRVADRYQDTMGFTVVGPDHFLGSGHPDTAEDLPPFLGLMESRDAGETWKPVSLLGEADFHVLEARGDRVYGFGFEWETRRPRFLVSSDGGESWDEREYPEPLFSMALHPADARKLAAAGEAATYTSADAGRSWRELDQGGGLLAWRSSHELIRIDWEGVVWLHSASGDWEEIGSIGGEPAALEAEADGLYVALHDGTIKVSSDGGSSWSVRFQS